MPNFVNNRFYLDPSKDFFDEFQEIIKMNKPKTPMIVLEDELVKGQQYMMQVEINHVDGDDIALFWNYMFKTKSNACHYIGIGTWGNVLEEEFIRENFSVYREDTYSLSSQIEFVFKDNEDVYNYIVSESKTKEGLDKWFNIYLSTSEDMNQVVFNSSHNGSELKMFSVEYDDVVYGLNLLDHRNVFIRIQSQEAYKQWVLESQEAESDN